MSLVMIKSKNNAKTIKNKKLAKRLKMIQVMIKLKRKAKTTKKVRAAEMRLFKSLKNSKNSLTGFSL